MSGEDYAADFYCGLGGWAEGFLAAGIKMIGFDIERHDYGMGGYPGQLVLQDVLSLHGSQFKDALCLVASPPCTEYSYMAMPWERAKQIARALRGKDKFPSGYTGSRTLEQLNALFNACFRIQREASEAADRHVPLIVENVKGAQPWVGRAQAHFGSFYLWGDVGQVGSRVIVLHGPLRDAGLRPRSRAQKVNPDGTGHPTGSWFAVADSKNRGAKSEGEDWSRFAKTGEVSPHWRMEAVKQDMGGTWFGNYEQHKARAAEHIKQGGDWFGETGPGELRSFSSHSVQRKAASAQIAKIPFPLAHYIAKQFGAERLAEQQPST